MNGSTLNTVGALARILKDALLVLTIVMLSLFGAGSYVMKEWQSYRATIQPLAISDTSIVIPSEVATTVGTPVNLRAETAGRRVVWLSLDPEVQLRERDQKSVWAFGSKPGEFRIVAWTSVNDLPTTNAVCILRVSQDQPKEGEPK